jgi:DNA helicase MCM9
LEANSVFVNNQQRFGVNVTDELISEFKNYWSRYQSHPLEGRDLILRSICPNIYGLFIVKLAVCLSLLGGVAQMDKGTKTRGESHLLLIGEPGMVFPHEDKFISCFYFAFL